MGQRANLVIVREGSWSLYYDHWCANRLDVELFWGPRSAAAFIEARDPLADREDWLDEVWCEGGAVLDEDRRRLLWFGGEDILYDVPLRRAHAALLTRQWGGWEVRWASGAIAELAGYVGVPEERVLVAGPPRGEFEVLTEYPEDNTTLLTVREHGRSSAARIHGDEEQLQIGPSQLPVLLAFPRARTLVWTGSGPRSGVHLDLDAQTLLHWNADPAAAVAARVARGWVGWRSEWLDDRFDEHVARSGMQIELPTLSTRALQRTLLKDLRRRHTRLGANPARELAPRLGATEINPWTDESRGSVGAEAEKLRTLDALESELTNEEGQGH